MTSFQDDWGLVNFSRVKQGIQNGIASQDFFKTYYRLNTSQDIKTVQSLKTEITTRFQKSTVKREDLFLRVNEFINLFCEGRQGEVIADNEIPWEQLERDLQEVMLECADRVYGNCRITYLPRFIDEPNLYGPLLKSILVNLPFPPQRLTFNHERRSVLRRYAGRTMETFRTVYTSTGHRNFYICLRNSWARRAVLFFDGFNSSMPYINHQYGPDIDFPYTESKARYIVHRTLQNFSSRNPPASQEQVNQLLNTHFAGYGRNGNRCYINNDIFFQSSTHGNDKRGVLS